MRLLAYGASHVGHVRRRNEDIAIVGRDFVRDGTADADVVLGPSERFTAGVADGLGGETAGDVASETAAREFVRLVDEAGANSTLRENLTRIAELTNDEVIRKPFLAPRLSGMATTLTAAIFGDDSVQIVHAGDTRLYRFRTQLERLTRDHSQQEMSGDPRIPRNILANCLGGVGRFFADTGTIAAADGDVFVFSSDGLTDMLSDDTIEDTLRDATKTGPGVRTAANNLVEAALSAGGIDNITVVVVAIERLRTERSK